MLDDLYHALTTGRDDEMLQRYTNEEISQFIQRNELQIENAVFEAYARDDELATLDHAENDWYREFLYEFVTLPEI